ncbi:hypothetical protein [Paenibacillus sp. A14]|uniref:hypothetical protein n=1 Tax=Paenibacillus sp. A14 TaxID=3119820 RepID=UPI002FE1E474
MGNKKSATRVKQAARKKAAITTRAARRYEAEAPWSDETFAFIAGYTEWGFPYGITWAEMESLSDQNSLNATLPPEDGSHRTLLWMRTG